MSTVGDAELLLTQQRLLQASAKGPESIKSYLEPRDQIGAVPSSLAIRSSGSAGRNALALRGLLTDKEVPVADRFSHPALASGAWLR